MKTENQSLKIKDNIKKEKNHFIIILYLFFSWIFGLAIDEKIQESIIQYPNSYKLYQLIQNTFNINKVITPLFIFFWIIVILIYVLNKLKKLNKV